MAQPCPCSFRSPDETRKPVSILDEETVKAVNKICRGQTVLEIFPGRIYHRDNVGIFQRAPGSRLMDYLILTDENVVYWERGESGQRTGFIGYPEIIDVECQTGPVFGDLIISARGTCVKLGDVPSKGVLHIQNLISGRIRQFRNVTRTLLSFGISGSTPAPAIFG